MAFPAGWDLVNITGTYVGRNGVPCVGTITLSSPQMVLRAGTIVPAADIVFDLVNGTFSGQIPATDDPNASPVGWTYTVTENVPGGRQGYQIVAPHTSPGIDLSTVIPIGMPMPPTFGFPYVTLAQLASTSTGQGIALIGWPSGFGITQPETNQFFTQNGAAIQRLSDRVFVGDAVKCDAVYPQVIDDWLSAYYKSIGVTYALQGMLVAETNNSPSSNVGMLTAAQTLHLTSAGQEAIGIQSVVLNNNATLNNEAWAFYGEAHQMTAAAGPAYAAELNTTSTVAMVNPTPYTQGSLNNIQLSSGGGTTTAGNFDNSCGIYFANAGAKFQKGIVFGSTAITGTDGVTGSATAIALGKGHALQWFATGDVATGKIISQGTSASNAAQLQLADGSVNIQTVSNGALQHVFSITDNAVNYFNLYSAVTGSPVQMLVGGADTNIDILIGPKGSGVLKLGNAGSMSANGSVATALTSVGPTGSHTTVQEWLTVKNNAGVIRYIPCF